MRNWRLGRAAIVLLPLLLAAAAAHGRELQGASVVGGRTAPKGRFGYYTTLRNALHGWHLCGSSLIHPQILLTAAHCVFMYNENETAPGTWMSPEGYVFSRARVGAWERNPIPASRSDFIDRQVIGVAVHAGYAQASGGYWQDVALLLLDSPVVGRPTVRFADETSLPLRLGNRVKAAGMFAIRARRHCATEEDFLKAVHKLWLSIQEPTTIYDVANFINAGVPPNYDKDVLGGDSGGPLIRAGSNAGEDVQYGLVSGGPIYKGSFPGWYTNVTRFASWIRRGMRVLLEEPGSHSSRSDQTWGDGRRSGQYWVHRLPACAPLRGSAYCTHCATNGQRLTCVADDGKACYARADGVAYIVPLCTDGSAAPDLSHGPRLPNRCYRSVQYKDRSGLPGTDLLGERVFAFHARSTTPPSEQNQCPTQGAFVLQRCPGSPPNTTCTAGASRLRPLRTAEGQPGCCACRRVSKQAGYTRAYYSMPSASRAYGSEPDCTYADRALLSGEVVHYTGAKLAGCGGQLYAQVLLQTFTPFNGVAYWPYWVRDADLVFCPATRACGTRAELGAYCSDAPNGGCCDLRALGGAARAKCVARGDASACAVG